MSDDRSLPNKVSASFQQLKAAATELNAVSDELGKAIAALDQALKGLNLGVQSWVTISKWYHHGPDDCYETELGYAKLGSKWGIALRSGEYNEAIPEDGRYETWLFSDAPRVLRVQGVEKLPELLEALIKEANMTTERVKAKIGYARQVVAGIGGPPAPPKPTAPKAPTESPQKVALGNLLSAVQQAEALEQATGLSRAAQADVLRAMEQISGLSRTEREIAIRAMEQATGLSKAAQADALRAMEQISGLSRVEYAEALRLMRTAEQAAEALLAPRKRK